MNFVAFVLAAIGLLVLWDVASTGVITDVNAIVIAACLVGAFITYVTHRVFESYDRRTKALAEAARAPEVSRDAQQP